MNTPPSPDDGTLLELARTLPTWAMRDALNERGLIVVEPAILDNPPPDHQPDPAPPRGAHHETGWRQLEVDLDAYEWVGASNKPTPPPDTHPPSSTPPHDEQ